MDWEGYITMDLKELRDDERINEWFEVISAKENTKVSYLDAMRLFTEMIQKTPNELIIEAKAEMKQNVDKCERSVRKYLLKFKKMLNEKGYAPMSATLRF